MTLTKQQAIEIFGNSGAELGRSVGLHRSRISQWPELLDQKQTDLVIGAAIRLGKSLPDGFAAQIEQPAAA
jgi:hypothetical protein